MVVGREGVRLWGLVGCGKWLLVLEGKDCLCMYVFVCLFLTVYVYIYVMFVRMKMLHIYLESLTLRNYVYKVEFVLCVSGRAGLQEGLCLHYTVSVPDINIPERKSSTVSIEMTERQLVLVWPRTAS